MAKAQPEWRRPKLCGIVGEPPLGRCIEVQIGENVVKIRPTDRRAVIVSKAEFMTFVRAIKDGDFDN